MDLISKKEAKDKGLTLFFIGKPCKRGHIAQRKVSNHSCIICHREGSKKWDKKHYLAHRDEVKARGKKDYAKNKERYLRHAHLQMTTGYMLQWVKKNRGKIRYYGNKRRAAKLNRTPSWTNHTILKEIYNNCPEGYQVDHIIPLQGKLVSGLHVPANLQYLTKSENCKKLNKFDPTTHEEPILC